MSPKKAELLLAQAREIYTRDPDQALPMWRHLAESVDVSPVWSNAKTELAAHELGVVNYEDAANHAVAVLEAPADAVDPRARAVAGIVLVKARDALGSVLDEALLASSIEASLSTGAPLWAGAGLMLLAELHIARGERAASKQLYERAIAA